MELNYLAFFLISFIPLFIGWFWFNSNSIVANAFNVERDEPISIGIRKLVFLFVLSVGLVYGYMNMTIHQLGFYELFFTDIKLGKPGAQQVVSDFMAKYGDKHRHFGHGLLHGAINAFLFILPVIAAITILQNRTMKFLYYHYSYWLLLSLIIGGLISAFV